MSTPYDKIIMLRKYGVLHSACFKQLCEDLYSKYGLQSTRNKSIVEKVGIFIYTLAMGASNRDVGERFQHSSETISRAFHEVLEAISFRSRGYQGLARDIIRSNDPTFQAIPSYITNDARYMPYFKIKCNHYYYYYYYYYYYFKIDLS